MILPFVGTKLSLPEFQWLLGPLKVSKEYGLAPTALVPSLRKEYARVTYELFDDYVAEFSMDKRAFTDLDVALVNAYQYYLDSLCQKCGTPAWYGRTEDSRVEFEIKHTVCYSCAALEEEDKKDAPKGQISYTHAHGTRYHDGTEEPLPPPEELIGTIK